MRWLAFVLLCVNISVWLGADFWVPDRTASVVTGGILPRVSGLKLETDSSETDATLADESPDRVSGPETPVEPVRRVRTCLQLGWFETAQEALEAYRSLGSPGDAFDIQERERTLDPLHWVIIPPQPQERALRLFNDLQRRGIDSYLVTRGENTNAISLGLFQSREAAERFLGIKKRQNLNAVLANFPRNQLSYALVFEEPGIDVTESGNGLVREYQDDFEMVEISRCEGVATASENP